MKEIWIGDRLISEHAKPFVIAEAGVNYYEVASTRQIDAIDAAKMMIAAAAIAGADAIKFQTYKAERLVSKSASSYWDLHFESTTSQLELFKRYDKFGEDEYKALKQFADKCNIVFLSTPFDEDSVDLLDELVPAFKIASSDITDVPLIEHIAKKQKPIFLSTGASTLQEITAAIDCIRGQGNKQLVLLHCILNYPTEYRDANLGMIQGLRSAFPDYVIGYSDHTLPDRCSLVLSAAVLLGARVIEKHFTLDRALPGNDHYHSMDPEGLRTLVENLQLLDLITKGEAKQPLETERAAIENARRSIIAKQDIPKGTSISLDLLTFKRPGTGISPTDVSQVVGRVAVRDIKEDDVIKWGDIRSP
ncbi:MAG: N-acetylneuraminate synthase family protein [Halobacteriota archaeon]|jgi:sialic acid synthase SpsE